MDPWILAVDVGNGVTKLGLARGCSLAYTWECTTPAALTADEALQTAEGFMEAVRTGKALICEGGALDAAEKGDGPSLTVESSILASVVPTLSGAWKQALERLCGARPLTVGPGIKTGFRMKYKDPGEVGADRIADMAGAMARIGAPVIVVDLGAVSTLDAIDGEGAFAGGAIFPGMASGAAMMASVGAKLPSVELKRPASVIGRSTAEAMEAGVVLGEAARIGGLLAMAEEELGCNAPTVITGAGAGLMAQLLGKDVFVVQALSLEGLAHLHHLNRKNR